MNGNRACCNVDNVELTCAVRFVAAEPAAVVELVTSLLVVFRLAEGEERTCCAKDVVTSMGQAEFH